jgi:hypothetical protein
VKSESQAEKVDIHDDSPSKPARRHKVSPIEPVSDSTKLKLQIAKALVTKGWAICIQNITMMEAEIEVTCTSCCCAREFAVLTVTSIWSKTMGVDCNKCGRTRKLVHDTLESTTTMNVNVLKDWFKRHQQATADMKCAKEKAVQVQAVENPELPQQQEEYISVIQRVFAIDGLCKFKIKADETVSGAFNHTAYASARSLESDCLSTLLRIIEAVIDSNVTPDTLVRIRASTHSPTTLCVHMGDNEVKDVKVVTHVLCLEQEKCKLKSKERVIGKRKRVKYENGEKPLFIYKYFFSDDNRHKQKNKFTGYSPPQAETLFRQFLKETGNRSAM